MNERMLTPEEIEDMRRDASDRRRDIGRWFTAGEVRRLLATLDAALAARPSPAEPRKTPPDPFDPDQRYLEDRAAEPPAADLRDPAPLAPTEQDR